MLKAGAEEQLLYRFAVLKGIIMQKAGAERMQKKKKKDNTQVLCADIHLSGLTEHILFMGVN